MRQPSSELQLYDFWRRSVAGNRVPHTEDDPQCGFYKRRMVRGGPFVPVEIWMEQEIDEETGELVSDERLCAISNGEPCNPLMVWLYCRPITAEEYDALTGVRETIPDMAATHAAVDLGHMAAIRP